METKFAEKVRLGDDETMNERFFYLI